MLLQEYDLVALMDQITSIHKAIQKPIVLKRGQVGTVLMLFNNEACLVDFVDDRGQTYAMETVPIDKLLRLVHEPEFTATHSLVSRSF